MKLLCSIQLIPIRCYTLSSRCVLNNLKGYKVPNCSIIKRTFLPPEKFNHYDKLIKFDRCSTDYELIYRSSYLFILKIAGIFAPICIGFVLVSSILEYLYRYNYLTSPKIFENFTLPVFRHIRETDIIVSDLLLLLLNVYILFIIKSVPLRIYYSCNRKDYVAIYQKLWNPWDIYKYNFKRAVNCKSFNPLWKDMTYKLDEKKSLLLIDHFRTPADLFKMMI